MISPRNLGKIPAALLRASISLVIIVYGIYQSNAVPIVQLLDTGKPFGETVNVTDREGWKAVPSNLFILESDPAKASSDPGYYGREYSFKGDAVVVTRNVTAAFWSAKGRLALYSNSKPTLSPKASPQDSNFGTKILELNPLPLKNGSATISHCDIVRYGGDEVALEVFFSGNGSTDLSATFTFGKSDIVEIRPSAKMRGMTLDGSLEYGLIPSFIGDDLIYSPSDDQKSETLNIPAENVFLGMIKGEENLLVMTWPKGKQELRLKTGNESGKRIFESMEFENADQSFYITILGAPGIWHKEELKGSYLEKDVASDWKKPFPAKWETQLSEAGVKTRFPFRETKGQVWRGVPGSYSYPVWFSDQTAYYHLSKKVAPKGESIIYFLEGEDTPPERMTPVDFMNATLGRGLCDDLLDRPGRKLRTHHRRGAEGVRRACTCGCTEAIQAVFEAGQEFTKREYVDGAVDDMIYFVQRHMERIDEYRAFMDETINFMRTKAKGSPELKSFVNSLEEVAGQLPQEYTVQKENMKSLSYAHELATQTVALASKKDPKNLETYLELGKAWRAMGGAQDYVLAQCHVITRRLFQEAGYGCASQPKAVELAQEIRSRCRKILRNPDGYEIWGEY